MLHLIARALSGLHPALSPAAASCPGFLPGKGNRREPRLKAFRALCSQTLSAMFRRLDALLRNARPDCRSAAVGEPAALSLPEKGSLLHFEAGDGAFLERFHAVRPQWELSAIESGPAFLELLGKDFLSSAANAGYRDADICRRYDLIVVTKPLDALNGPGEALGWLSRRLTDGGTLYLRQPLPHANGASLFGAPHGVRIRIGSLTTLCTAAGLAVKEVTIRDDAICLCARKEARHAPRLPLGEHDL